MDKADTLLQTLKSFTILYIEDEPVIQKEMEQVLSLLCKEVFSYSTAKEAYEGYKVKTPDIILSDISLEEESGIEFVKQVRQTDKKTPIILLSAHTDTAYLLEASKLKLVAYLTKPIHFEELKQTLFEAVEEHLGNDDTKQNLFSITDSISFDTEHKTLQINNKQKKLSSYESRLLAYFIKNKTRTLSPEELKNHVWDDPYDATDTALKSLIYKLRTKIGKDTVQNLSGVGYYLNLPQ